MRGRCLPPTRQAILERRTACPGSGGTHAAKTNPAQKPGEVIIRRGRLKWKNGKGVTGVPLHDKGLQRRSLR